MYWEYFGFEENPFSISPDPRYLYMSKRHQEALAHLVYGIGEAGGFVLLSGEVGTGKTTICRSLIEQLPDTVDLAFVLNPRLNEIELLATICDEMAVSYPRPDPSLKVLVDRLNEHLLRAHAIGRQPVLLIDEAQNLDPKVLEQIRLLTNLETNKRKLLQIVLIGQPELNELLARPDLRQLDQRITARYHLRPLTIQETGGYIRHRLQVGGAPIDIFSDRAIRAIYRATGGIPRLINTLCDRCLLGAYAENKRKVDAKLVKSAAKEVLSRRTKSRPSFAIPGLLAATVAAAAFLLIDPLKLNVPGNVMSLTETELASDDTAAPPEPIADVAETVGTADSPGDVAPGLDLGDVAAAEIGDEPRADGTSESVSEPDDDPAIASTHPAGGNDGDVSLLPPPPPPPPSVDASISGPEANVPPLAGPPVIPPSPAPTQLAALDDASLDLGQNRTGQIEPPGQANGEASAAPDEVDASTTPNVKYERGTWSAIGNQTTVTDAPSPSTVSTDAPTEVAALTPTSDAGEASLAPMPKRSLEQALIDASSPTDLESALRVLFASWDFKYAEMKGLSPCKKARYANLRCLQGQGTWHELKTANRPALITLSVDEVTSQYGVLISLSGETAEIMLGDGETVETNVGALSRLWTGDYLLLWRPPAQFSRELKLGLRGDDVLWLRDRLTKLGWDTSGAADQLSYDDGLQEAVRRFQRRRGLTVDGIAGPRTILQVNAALGSANTPTIQ